jgi:hypothetical protein
MTRNTEERANSSSLREDLDAGRGRDKVPYPDPAAAPLGTDDEAAGTPVTEEQLRMARRHEIRGEGGTDTAAPALCTGARPATSTATRRCSLRRRKPTASASRSVRSSC